MGSLFSVRARWRSGGGRLAGFLGFEGVLVARSLHVRSKAGLPEDGLVRADYTSVVIRVDQRPNEVGTGSRNANDGEEACQSIREL